MAAKRIAVSYDFLKNEIQNALAHVLASAPGSPTEGQFYYDSTTKRLNWRTDTQWIDPTARAFHTGTQAWSTITGTPTTLAGYGITDAQTLDADLTAIAALSGTGLLVRTGAGTWAERTLSVSSTPALSITNPAGVAGNPTFSIADATTSDSGLMSASDKTKLNGIATGATANSSDAFLLARANHTGTQLASTISDFDTQVRTNRLDQMAAPTANVSLNSQRIVNLQDPTADQDAATKKYVDDKVAGLNWKDEVMAASTGPGTLATDFENGDTLDGYTLVTGDRILLKNQTAQTENGLYVVNASGAPTRSDDANTGAELRAASVYVVNGSTNGGSRWTCNNTTAITIGSTNITFASFGGGATYTNGDGLDLTGNVFSVVADTGILVSGTGVAVDPAVVARKHTALIGNGASTSLAVTHSLGNQWVTAQVVEVATSKLIECDIEMTSSSVTTFIFAVAPASNAYRVIITG